MKETLARQENLWVVFGIFDVGMRQRCQGEAAAHPPAVDKSPEHRTSLCTAAARCVTCPPLPELEPSAAFGYPVCIHCHIAAKRIFTLMRAGPVTLYRECISGVSRCLPESPRAALYFSGLKISSMSLAPCSTRTTSIPSSIDK